MARLDVAVFEMLHAELHCNPFGFGFELTDGLGVANGSTVNTERQGSERMAEEPRLDLGKRQHTRDVAGALGQEEPGLVAEDVFYQSPPCRQMEEGSCGCASTNASQRDRSCSAMTATLVLPDPFPVQPYLNSACFLEYLIHPPPGEIAQKTA